MESNSLAKRNLARIGLVTDGGMELEELPHALTMNATSGKQFLAARGKVPNEEL